MDIAVASYKRTIYLIDPKFQLKFAAFVTSLVFFCSLIYPWVIYDAYSKLISLANNNGLANTAQKLIEQKSSVIQLLILFQLVFVALVFIICIFQSHKIAGPLYKLRKYLNAIREGNSQDKLYFRKGDNFKDLAQEYNLAIDAINRTILDRSQMLEELVIKLSERIQENPSSEEKEFYNEVLRKVSEIQTHQART